MTWTAAVTAWGDENEASEQLLALGLGFSPYIPRFLRRTVLRGRRVLRPATLFPRYVWVVLNEFWPDIVSVKSVRYLLVQNEKPIPVPDVAINRLKASEGPDGFVRIRREPFVPGTKVQVQSGALVGQVGFYKELNEKDEAVVLLNALGRYVPVALAEGSLAQC